MKTFVKNYVGKGKTNKFDQFEIIRATIPVSQIMLFKYEKGGKEYFTFEIAKLKEPDHFENTHTLYVNVAHEVDAPTSANEPEVPQLDPPKTTKKRKATAKK
ncbi:MAG: hypothetical protein ACOYN4_07805 [Bacteroidales bacterium]